MLYNSFFCFVATDFFFNRNISKDKNIYKGYTSTMDYIQKSSNKLCYY